MTTLEETEYRATAPHHADCRQLKQARRHADASRAPAQEMQAFGILSMTAVIMQMTGYSRTQARHAMTAH